MSNRQRSLIGRDKSDPTFWVVTCYYNACQYQNRYKNYFAFWRSLQRQNVKLLTVELCASDDTAHLSGDYATQYVRIVASDVLWAKERLLNIGIDHLPPECTKVCWCDCDILFKQPGWAWMCSDMLDKHRVVQPFSQGIFLAADETPEMHRRFQPSNSFAKVYLMDPVSAAGTTVALGSSPGYVWAARRDVLARCNGLFDKSILGHGDIVAATAFSHSVARDGPMPVGIDSVWKNGWSAALWDDVRAWQTRAAEVVDGDIGMVCGVVYHLWHGSQRNRNYKERGMLLADFQPSKHLVTNPATGMWQWTPAARAAGLDARCKLYFKKRNEDSSGG